MVSDPASLQGRYNRLVRNHQFQLGKAEQVHSAVVEFENEVERLSGKVVKLGKVLGVFHAMSSQLHEELTVSFERLVTSGIQSVFGDDVSFKMVSSFKADQVSVDFKLVMADGTELSPLDSRGGGIAALTGVVVRIVVLRLLGNRTRQVLILDEPIAHLSDEYVEAAGLMLAELAKSLNVQLLMITHQPQLAEFADVVYRVQGGRGGATVSKVR